MPFCSKKGSAYGTSDREEYMEKKTTALGTVNNEVDFCKVYDMGTKEQIERILLANRISYSFRIHDEEVPRAKRLVASVLGNKNKRKEIKK